MRVLGGSGGPVEDAAVTVGPGAVHERRTGPDGVAAFESDDPDSFRNALAVVVDHPDFVTHREELELRRDFYATRRHVTEVRLQPGAPLSVRLVDEGDSPVAHGIARVRRILDAGVSMPVRALSEAQWRRDRMRARWNGAQVDVVDADAQGVARFRLEPGRYALTAWKQGFSPEHDDRTTFVLAEAGLELVHRMRRGASVEGRVVDGDRRGIEGASVLCQARSATSGARFAAATSDADGRFRVEGLPLDAERLSLLCTKEGYVPLLDEPRALDEDVELVLGKGRSVLLRCKDSSSGRPIEDGTEIRWRAKEVDRGALSLWIQTHWTPRSRCVEGACRLEGVPAFARGLEVEAPGFAPKDVALPEGDWAVWDLDLALDPLEECTVVVVDDGSGDVLDGASLQVWTRRANEDGYASTTRTSLAPSRDPDGNELYRLGNAHVKPDAEAHLVAHHPRCLPRTVLFKAPDEPLPSRFVVRLQRLSGD